ncbi:MAG: efflux RND transporter periplasmic adaptor subunit [Pseudomonadales bacterium]|jgi:membrane fusion protein (multidrug efflux system)|nr:efflux RND transporter periplasmic adaptor subunit [Pseudomonadales bacterium]
MTDLLRRTVVSLLLLAVVGGLGYWVFLRVAEEQAPAQARGGSRPTPVVVARVVSVPFTDTVQAVGSAAANESVLITANVSERIASIEFDEGAFAAAGSVLVRLDTSQEQAELAEALANLDDQRQQFERLDRLVATNSAALSQRDQQKALMEAADARVQIVRARIADRVIRAPFDGLTGLRSVSVGAQVAPGTLITTLDDIHPIRLDFSVPESFLSVLRLDAVIRARSVAYPDQPFEGRVAHISPRVDPVTRTVAIRAEIPNEDGRLRPGMLFTVDLVRDRREGLMVPEAALVPRGDRQYLFRIVEGVAEQVEVGIGSRRPGIVELTSGVAAGDIVVVEGSLRLRPGAAVVIQSEVDALASMPDEAREASLATDRMDEAAATEVGG